MRESTTAVTAPAEAEAGLVSRARLGDEAAIRALVQQNNRRLYRVTRAVLDDDRDAEDAVQEAYLRAFTRLDSFRGDSGFATWLTRIALNEALQRLRRRRRTLPDQAAETRSAHVIVFPESHSAMDPESATARHQLRGMIEGAVERLPRPLRLVFVLREIEELSTAETAGQLGLPEATVKTRLHRARRQLREHLDTEIAATLTGTFPFAGARCARMADSVVARLRG